NVTTPLLLITGENDWRTPISETEQYYRALKIQKIDSVMVRVPNEAHGVRARPSHYIAKMLHILEWFQKYGKEEDSSGDE
ncbi:MAG: prolyl oligopeptidase family serine peptidase, partial [Candidatus Hydrogenedentota bacterium]